MRARLRIYGQRFREPAQKRKATVFMLCVFCSAVFWLFIKLSADTQATFTIPVVFHEPPEGHVVIGQSASEAGYVLQASGMRLLRLRFGASRDSLRVSLAALPAFSRDGSLYRVLTAGSLKSLLEAHTEAGQFIASTWPDSLLVETSPGMRLHLPLELNAHMDFEKRFDLYGEPRLLPDSIWIEGPAAWLDTVERLQTVSLEFSSLNQTVDQQVAVRPPLPHDVFSLDPPSVRLLIPVEEYTESAVQLDVLLADPGYESGIPRESIRLFPKQVTVTYLVALRDYHRVNEQMFQVFAAYPDSLASKARLRVYLGQYPDFVHVNDIRPSSLDYLILR